MIKKTAISLFLLLVIGLNWTLFGQTLTNGVVFPSLTGDVTSTPGLPPVSTVGRINGTTVPVNAAADQVLLTSAAAAGSWASVGACLDSGGNHLNYNVSTHSFLCGTTSSSGTPSFSTLAAGTSTVAMFMGTGGSLGRSGTGIIDANQLMSTPISGLTGPMYLTAGVPTAETSVQAVAALGTTPALSLGTTTLTSSVLVTNKAVSASAYTALATDNILLVNTSTAATALTLPSAASACVSGNCQVIVIKDGTGTATTNNITVAPPTGTLDGNASMKINANYGYMKVTSNGTNWLTIP